MFSSKELEKQRYFLKQDSHYYTIRSQLKTGETKADLIRLKLISIEIVGFFVILMASVWRTCLFSNTGHKVNIQTEIDTVFVSIYVCFNLDLIICLCCISI